MHIYEMLTEMFTGMKCLYFFCSNMMFSFLYLNMYTDVYSILCLDYRFINFQQVSKRCSKGCPPSPPKRPMAGLTVRWACRHQAIATAGQGVDMGITTARMGKTDHGALRSRGWCDFDYLCFCHVLSRMIDTGYLFDMTMYKDLRWTW